MKIIELSLNNISRSNIEDLHLCLGYFDAIHIGHQKIIKQATADSNNVGVLTFDVPPAFKLGYRDSERTITSLYDRSKILEEYGVKYMFVLPFNEELIKLDYLAFIHCVIDSLHPSKIYCGEDYTFGYLGKGTIKDLKMFYDVNVISTQLDSNGSKISSRYIINDIKSGNIKRANALLNRMYSLTGIVCYGKQLGRKLGFPTANIELDYPNVLPKEGVYACYAVVNGERYKAVMCFSKQPTFNVLDNPVIEVYFLDFDKEIYGETVTVELFDFIRDIKRFDNTSLLINQLNIDIETAKSILD